MHIHSAFVTVIGIAVSLTACTVRGDVGTVQAAVATCGDDQIRLIAAQNIDIGVVRITHDESELCVEYVVTAPGWSLSETHLALAASPSGLPQTPSGNPRVGLFPYQHTGLQGQNDSYCVDYQQLGFVPGEPVYVAAHAVVVEGQQVFAISETAWGEGTDFPGNNWAMYYEYDLASCGPEPCMKMSAQDLEITWMTTGEPDLGNSAMDCSLVNVAVDACCDGELVAGGVAMGQRYAGFSHPFCTEFAGTAFYLEYRVFSTASVCPDQGVTCSVAGQDDWAANIECQLDGIVDEVGGIGVFKIGGEVAEGAGTASWTYEHSILRLCVADSHDGLDHIVKWEAASDDSRPAAMICRPGTEADCYCANGT